MTTQFRASDSSAITALKESRVVVVVRTRSRDGIVQLAESLAAGGVRHMEITMTVPGALEAITAVANKGIEGLHVGSGTVLTASDATATIDAGADFVVSPILDHGVVEAAHSRRVPAIPGCLTPTEIAQAMRLGVGCTKLFPGRVATPGFFKDVLGPFPEAKLMPTGNVDVDTAPEYLRAGAVAVGVGRAIVDPDEYENGDWAAITARARRFVTLLRDVQEERK